MWLFLCVELAVFLPCTGTELAQFTGTQQYSVHSNIKSSLHQQAKKTMSSVGLLIVYYGVCFLQGSQDVKGTIYFEDIVR